MNPSLHILLALVIAIGFCLLLVAGSLATVLLVTRLQGGPIRIVWMKLPPRYIAIYSCCFVLIFLLSFGVLYLPPEGRYYAVIGAIVIPLSAFIAIRIHINSQLRDHTP